MVIGIGSLRVMRAVPWSWDDGRYDVESVQAYVQKFGNSALRYFWLYQSAPNWLNSI
jgi:hypothetical protein